MSSVAYYVQMVTMVTHNLSAELSYMTVKSPLLELDMISLVEIKL